MRKMKSIRTMHRHESKVDKLNDYTPPSFKSWARRNRRTFNEMFGGNSYPAPLKLQKILSKED